MTAQSQETQLAVLKKAVEALEKQLSATADDIEALQDERNRALKWGIMTLGAAVAGMAYWIFNKLVGGHIS